MSQDNLTTNLIDKVIALCKRRGFIFPGSEIYGGLANSWDYGPLGVELKNNIKNLWWKRFVQERDDIVGIDASLIMNPKVWEASGHLENFTDPLIECKQCNQRFRADNLFNETFKKQGGWSTVKKIVDEKNLQIFKLFVDKYLEDLMGVPSDSNFTKDGFIQYLLNNYVICDSCGEKNWVNPKEFSLMFKTFIGPAEETSNLAYFRPETAQAMFVDFKNILDTTRIKLPFGIAQIGKAFRNEITPGNFIFRTREFEQMEIEYFIKPPKTDEEWQKVFEMWRTEMIGWIRDVLGVNMEKVHELEVSEKDRAHYSKRTVDFEYDFPFGRNELYGLAYRTDFDLKNHFSEPPYKDSETGEEFWPHVIEPTWGVDRSVLVVLVDHYVESEGRVYLKLPVHLAPYKVAVFPLLPNKPELVKVARKIYEDLRKDYMVAWDDRGNIGKRYASQDEIGTPYCITVDFDTLKDETVTIRDRDTTKQRRVKITELRDELRMI